MKLFRHYNFDDILPGSLIEHKGELFIKTVFSNCPDCTESLYMDSVSIADGMPHRIQLDIASNPAVKVKLISFPIPKK